MTKPILRCLLLISFLFTGCARPASFSYFHPESPRSTFLLKKVREIEKKDFDNTHLETLAVNSLSSHHLVLIRKEEPLHFHANHDAWALVLKGEGEFWLENKKLRLRPGVSVFIPRGLKHRALRQGKTPLAAFVVFTPAYDGKDTLPATD